jgi:hypothetical protein
MKNMNDIFKGVLIGGVIGFIIGLILVFSVFASSGTVVLDRPSQRLIDEAVAKTNAETGQKYTLIPVYIETGEHVGFLIDINNSGKYMYLGNTNYPSVFQEN